MVLPLGLRLGSLVLPPALVGLLLALVGPLLVLVVPLMASVARAVVLRELDLVVHLLALAVVLLVFLVLMVLVVTVFRAIFAVSKVVLQPSQLVQPLATLATATRGMATDMAAGDTAIGLMGFMPMAVPIPRVILVATTFPPTGEVPTGALWSATETIETIKGPS